MQIVDNDAIMNAPTSKFLKKEEYSHLYPGKEHMPHRKNYIFKYNIPLTVNDNLGNLLLSKYFNLKRVDLDNTINIISEKLYNMSYNKLKNVAVKHGYKYRQVMVKKEKLIQMIIEKELENA